MNIKELNNMPCYNMHGNTRQVKFYIKNKNLEKLKYICTYYNISMSNLINIILENFFKNNC